MNTFHLGVIVHVRHYTYTELTSSQNVSMLCNCSKCMKQCRLKVLSLVKLLPYVHVAFSVNGTTSPVLQQRRHPLQSLAFPCTFPACSNPSPPSPKAENLVYLVHYKFS